MPLTELQRQSYLETMGIQSYFPRFILPGAKESTLCAWPENIEMPQVAEEEADLGASLETGLQATEQLQTEFSKLAESTATAEKPRVVEAPKQSSVDDIVSRSDETTGVENNQEVPETLEEVRFQLAFIRINDEISILNQIPYVGTNTLSQAHRALLLNILKSLSLPTDNIQFDDLPFRWPIIEGDHIDKGKKAASATLHSYLEQKQSDGNFKLLLVMGEMARSFVMPETDSWRVINTRSLDEMLTMPQFKKDVWQQLQVLALTDPN